MPSTAVARQNTRDLVASSTLTPEQVGLIKRQLMSSKREATDDELALFIHQCDRTGLDPFSDQIYAIYRWDRNSGDEKMKVQVSIHGLRLIADRTKAYAPGNEYWCGEDGVWRDVWLESKPPKAARVTVRKLVGNQLVEFSVPATWAEFSVTNSSGKLTGLWPTKPALMLAKCSEALALRKAFPNETSGLYTAEEMGRADADADDAFVAVVKDQFDAVEIDANGRAMDAAPPAKPKPKPAAPEPTPDIPAAPAEVADPDAKVTAEETAKLLEYLDKIGAPESFWRMGLMTQDLDDLSQLTRGQARKLMEDAKARYAPEKA